MLEGGDRYPGRSNSTAKSLFESCTEKMLRKIWLGLLIEQRISNPASAFETRHPAPLCVLLLSAPWSSRQLDRQKFTPFFGNSFPLSKTMEVSSA
jgi:hypothetical protein